MAKSKQTAQRNACINNLRMIDGAKNQWALEKTKASGDVPTWEDLQPYLGKSKAMIRCPTGGAYTIGAVGQPPICSIPGHMLPSN